MTSDTLPRIFVRALASLLALMLAAPSAHAGELRARPSLAVAEAYDSNVLSEPEEPEPDYVTRVSPGLELVWLSRTGSFTVRYGLDADYYREHPELNQFPTRQEGALDARWAMGPLTQMELFASHEETQIPGELNLLTGLQLGRTPAQRTTARAGLEQRLGSLTGLRIDYEFSHDSFERSLVGEGGFAGDRHQVGLGLDRQVGPGDTILLRGELRQFESREGWVGSNAATLGWKHRLGRRTHFELAAGPRRSRQEWGLEASAALRHTLRRGELALVYTDTETAAVGLVEPVVSRSLVATLSVQPTKRITLALSPGVYRTQQDLREVSVYQVAAEIGWQATSWLLLAAEHGTTLQRGDFAGPFDIDRSVTALRITLAPPARPRRPDDAGIDDGPPGSDALPVGTESGDSEGDER